MSLKMNKEEINAKRRERYRAKNKAEVSLKRKNYREAHREQINFKKMQSYWKHRDEINIRRKERYLHNKDDINVNRRLEYISKKVSILAQIKAYRAAHKDEINAKRREKYSLHKVKFKLRNKRNYEKHKDNYLEHDRNYRLKNAEKIKLRKKIYREKYPGHIGARGIKLPHWYDTRIAAWKKYKIVLLPRYRTYWEMYSVMYVKAGGKCEICGKNVNIRNKGNGNIANLDHGHPTGYPRGILCKSCNLHLAKIEELGPNVSRLEKYMEKYKDVSHSSHKSMKITKVPQWLYWRIDAWEREKISLLDQFRTYWEMYSYLFINADRKCEICNEPLRTGNKNNKNEDSKLGVACLDHDHLTGDPRGILCVECNALVGNIENNPEGQTYRFLEYLNRFDDLAVTNS